MDCVKALVGCERIAQVIQMAEHRLRRCYIVANVNTQDKARPCYEKPRFTAYISLNKSLIDEASCENLILQNDE